MFCKKFLSVPVPVFLISILVLLLMIAPTLLAQDDSESEPRTIDWRAHSFTYPGDWIVHGIVTNPGGQVIITNTAEAFLNTDSALQPGEMRASLSMIPVSEFEWELGTNPPVDSALMYITSQDADTPTETLTSELTGSAMAYRLLPASGDLMVLYIMVNPGDDADAFLFMVAGAMSDEIEQYQDDLLSIAESWQYRRPGQADESTESTETAESADDDSMDIDATRNRLRVAPYINYYLVIPEGDAPEGGWPLLIAHHGVGQDGTTMATMFGKEALEQGFAVIAPSNPTFIEYTGAIQNILLEVEEFYPVNPDKIVLYGMSGGGEAVSQYTQQFADEVNIQAVILNSPHSITAPESAEIPYFVYYGEYDGLLTINQPVIDSLMESGYPLTLEIIPGSAHEPLQAAIDRTLQLMTENQ